jgi:alkylation response protein AidB-like acyl-CoA dehydrogenase
MNELLAELAARRALTPQDGDTGDEPKLDFEQRRLWVHVGISVTRAFMDARVQRIYAGTNELMKVIVAKQMGL